MNTVNLSVHVWTDWDYIDWFNSQIYSAHYDAWFKHQCEMMDEPTEEEMENEGAA